MKDPRRFCILSAALLLAPLASAQDLYDTTILRTINLTFYDENWLELLEENYWSETNILADLEMEGEVCIGVGVRIRGNTSYTQLPPESVKYSLNVEVDFTVPDQDLLGYDSLNLNNGHRDPTFCREVVANNLCAQYMPNPRANHVVLTLNGENWGVYINVQEHDKTFLREHFADEDGLRIKCGSNPNGPGLNYNGDQPWWYQQYYEIKCDGGLPDPWGALIDVCYAVTYGSLNNPEEIDSLFAIDPSIWSVVMENLLTDDDSYVNKGADFITYRDPVDGRMHLLQRDANETFREIYWSPTKNFTAPKRPVLTHVLDVPELRQRYMAHYRTVLETFDWDTLEAEFYALRDLIDQAVQDDDKKLYSYELFLQNFTTEVTLPPYDHVIGLQEFVEGREAYLGTVSELNAAGPTITDVQASASFPDPDDPVYITAEVASARGAVALVELYFRAEPGIYDRVEMLDDGMSGDGAAGDGVFGVLVPIDALAGQDVSYYVAATEANGYWSMSFEPALAENGPLTYSYSFGDGGVRITEYMYSGDSGEYVEFTNLTDEPIDLTGWSMDDDSATPGTVSLSDAGVLQPGQSFLIVDVEPVDFAADWGLVDVVILGPNTDANFGRNDQINLYDADDNLVDRLTYGDEDFPGTIRAKEVSGQACKEIIGQDDIYGWVYAEVGDSFGSYEAATGDIGSPGIYIAVPCCVGDIDGDGDVDTADLLALLGAWGEAGGPADVNNDGIVNTADLLLLLGNWGLCE